MPNLLEYQSDDLIFRYAVDQSLCPDTYKMHMHEDIEFFIFCRGSGSYIIEGTEYQLAPQDILVMRNAEAHMPKISPHEPYGRMVFNVRPSFLEKIDPSGLLLRLAYEHPLGQRNRFRSSDYSKQAWEALEELTYCHEQNPDLLRLTIISRFVYLLSELARAYSPKSETDVPSDPLPNRILRYVNDELFNDLSLETISAHFYVSKSQLGKIFKNTTGTSVWEYISIKRLIAAREMILSGHSAQNACMSCGFNDYSSFYRAYKLKFNVSPSQDKENNMGHDKTR
ncbi:MAG: AraC family transcriptional regulator [Clostridiales bacterium]|nr:AraC family transcriptional regulator [Clostridiales bacterium]